MADKITTVAVSGASGLVGKSLSLLLQKSGHRVVAISRNRTSGPDSILWDPSTGIVNPDLLSGVDAIVHLAGENIAGARWTTAVKERIRSSRVDGTRSLVESLRKARLPPKVLISASAIGYYGDRRNEVLTEGSSQGSGFLSDVCSEWEHSALQAVSPQLRVVCLRIGVVLSRHGGALAKMLLPFRMGLGGIVGSGLQYWSWIGLHDLTRVIAFCLENPKLEGPVNAVSPQPLTNREFTKCLGAVLHRPTIFPMPAFAAKLALGEMANDLLLSSTRVVPEKLLKHGFSFEEPNLEGCLRRELGQA